MSQSQRAAATGPVIMPLAITVAVFLITLVPVWLKGQYQLAGLGILLLLGGVTLLLLSARRYEWTTGARRATVILLGWLGLLAVNVWSVSQVRLESSMYWWWWVVGAVVAMVTAVWSSFRDFDRHINWAVIGAGLVGAVVAAVMYLGSPNGRAGGLFGNANALGPFLLWPLFLMLPLVWRRPRRWWLVAGWMVTLIMFLLAVSVTSVAAAAPVVALLIILWRPKPVTRKWWLMIGATAVVLIGAWFIAKPIITAKFLPATNAEISLRQRKEFIGTAWRMVATKPWTGLGLQTFQIESPRFTHQALEQPRYAHNFYLQSLAELGWPMAVLWVAIVVYIGWCGWKSWRIEREEKAKLRRQAMWFGWLALTIAAGLDFGWYYPAVVIPWWMISGYFMGQAGPIKMVPNWTRLITVMAGIALLWFGMRAALADLRVLQANQAASNLEPDRQVLSLAAAVDLFPSRNAVLGYGKLLVQKNTDESRVEADVLLNKYLPTNKDDYSIYQLVAELEMNKGDKDAALAAYAKSYALDPRFHHDMVLEYLQLLIAMDKKTEAQALLTDFFSHVSAYTPNMFNAEPYKKIQDLAKELK